MMNSFSQMFRSIRKIVAIALLLSALFAPVLSGTAIAAESMNQAQYITPDGEDITAVVECIPKQLSEGDLQRAIAESGKDFLERVFQTKDSYSDYETTQAEQEFQSCLQSKGVISVVRQS